MVALHGDVSAGFGVRVDLFDGGDFEGVEGGSGGGGRLRGGLGSEENECCPDNMQYHNNSSR